MEHIPKFQGIKLSVVMPVYNEIHTIGQIMEEIMKVPILKEIIIVDDFSSDGTREYLRQVDGKKDDFNVIKVLFHPENRGKGAALKTGFQEVTGDIVIVQDADLEYSPGDYPQLIELIAEDKADVVYGSRFMGKHRLFLFTRYLGHKMLNLFANLLYNTSLSDLCTCYKAFKAEIIKDMNLRSNGFGLDAELTGKVLKRGLRLYEVPIYYAGRESAEGKKITWRDAFIHLYWLLRVKFQGLDGLDVGTEALFALARASKYNNYIFRCIEPWLGNKILEVGAGIGNITYYLIPKRQVIATELSDEYINILRRRFKGCPNLEIEKYDLREKPGIKWKEKEIDTIVGINVMEHVENDENAIQQLCSLLAAGGRLILFVPAHAALYSPLDRSLHHFRRYSKKVVKAKLERVGLKILKLSYINAFGALGWLVNGKIFRRRRFSPNQMYIFNLLMPLVKLVDLLHLPFGLSLVVVAEKGSR